MGEKTIIEVNGVKLEVDLRQARRIDTLAVGDRVKVLQKIYDGYAVHSGTIIGFEPFNKLTTVIIAYLSKDYNSADVKFVYFNAQSKDVEVVKAIDDDHLEIDRGDVLRMFERELQKKRDEISDIERKRDFFMSKFKAYWPELARVDLSAEGETHV